MSSPAKDKNGAEADGEGMYFHWIPESIFRSELNEAFTNCWPAGFHAVIYILGPRKFTFPSHQSHMLTLAKMCQDNSDYTDCVIQCGDFSSDDTEEEHERNR